MARVDTLRAQLCGDDYRRLAAIRVKFLRFGICEDICGYAPSASELARFHVRLKFDSLVTVAEPKGAQE